MAILHQNRMSLCPPACSSLKASDISLPDKSNQKPCLEQFHAGGTGMGNDRAQKSMADRVKDMT